MRRWAMVVMATLTGTVAFGQDVKVDFDKKADFSKLQSFAVKIGTSWNNSISEQRFISQFEKTLVAKGWTKNDTNPDALVVLHGATGVKKTLNTFYSDMGGYGGYGWRGGGMGMSSSTTTESEYTVGTLVADIFDTKTKQLVFRGTASDEVSDKPDKNIKKIEKATAKMFKEFPPGSKEKK
jgi:Domain of unknown function (DUF4136)